MKDYVFFTSEGWMTPPNENMTVENCQLLGFAKGNNKDYALERLILENPWIIKCGFDISQITGVRVIRESEI